MNPPTNRRPLENLRQLSPQNVARVRALGIHSVEALAARLAALTPDQAANWRDALRMEADDFSSLLSETQQEVEAFLNFAANSPPVLAQRGALPPAGIRADETTVTEVERLLLVSRSTGGGTVNLIPRLGPIRNQGLRGTCVAQALCALREYHATVDECLPVGSRDYSPQFLFWWCKEHDGWPNLDGTYAKTACAALVQDGVCLEPEWPYNKLPGSTVGQGPAPSEAVVSARSHRMASLKMLSNPRDDAAIRLALDAGRVVAVCVQTYSFWSDAEICRSGQISLPLGEDPAGGHAVLLVGYDPAEESFIFRNSWDLTWAYESRYGPGYGALPYQYIRQDGWEACC